MTGVASDQERIISAKLRSFSLEGLGVDALAACDFLVTEMQDEISDLNSVATKEARRSFFKVSGTSAEDYTEHIVSLSGGEVLRCGIRHFGGDSSKPFVLLEASIDIKELPQAQNIYREVSPLFEVFGPLQVCFHSSENIGLETSGNILYAEKAGLISAQSAWPGENELELRAPQDQTYYSWYKGEYEKFHQVSPELASKIAVNSLDVMEESRAQGLLFCVYYEGQLGGMVAAERSSFLGHDGFYFNEIFLSEHMRGQGLAKALQRKFIENYCACDSIVWGTIDAANMTSQATAKRNRRRAIRFENFFTT